MNSVYTSRLSDFLMIFIGILIESLPFVVIGVLISAFVGVYIQSNWILKYKSKNKLLSHIQSMFIGLFLPVCECGNIPLAKRLLLIGFKPSEVITFMLAAPIINPLVWITTAEAFNLDKNIAWIRIIAGSLIALAVGLFFSLHSNPKSFLTQTGRTKKVESFQGFSQTLINPKAIQEPHSNSFIDIFRDEFFTVFKMLLLGSFLAAAFQMFVPRSVIYTFGSDPTWSVFALMFLAFIVSMCSTVDAFFALALASTFSLGSILSFLVFGPMIDIKTLSMLRSVFTAKSLLAISVLTAVLCMILGFGVNYFYHFNY